MVRKKEKREKTEMIFLIIILLILFITIGIFLVKFIKLKKNVENFEYFEYDGFKYYIENYGNLTFYHTKFYFHEKNLTFDLYLRNDPRTNNIPLNIERLKVINPVTYIAIDKNFDEKNCTELIISSYSLGIFISPITVVESAIYYENYSLPTYKNLLVIKNISFSEENNVTLIILKYGEEKKVENINNTIIIQSEYCQILQPTEKFILFLVNRLKKNKYILPIV